MKICSDIQSLRDTISEERAARKPVVLVPTMGNLHDGHLSLVRKARETSDLVVVSIFVNPLQFGANEDLANYPKTLAEDKARLQLEGASVLFLPDAKEMYPDGQQGLTSVQVPELNAMLCGESRPVHFDGVCTVVNKLFNIVQPDCAVFGEKDFQQLFIIRKMVADLSMPVNVIGVPIMREKDGLAMSSRNGYLSPTERKQAPAFSRVLNDLVTNCQGKGTQAKLLENAQLKATVALNEMGFKVDYIQIRDANTLLPPDQSSTELVLLAAAYLGKTRLIDNLCFRAH